MTYRAITGLGFAYTCETCGTMTFENDRDTHTQWHERDSNHRPAEFPWARHYAAERLANAAAAYWSAGDGAGMTSLLWNALRLELDTAINEWKAHE